MSATAVVREPAPAPLVHVPIDTAPSGSRTFDACLIALIVLVQAAWFSAVSYALFLLV